MIDRKGDLNGPSRFRDVSPQPATYADTARQEPRPPGMTDRHLEIDGSDFLARPAAETKLEILSTKFEGAGDHVCGDGGPQGQRPRRRGDPARRRGAILLRTKPILMIT